MRSALLIGATLCTIACVAQYKQVTTLSLASSNPLTALPCQLLLGVPYEYERLGLFCKLDVQLERRLGLPVFIRLGYPRSMADRGEFGHSSPHSLVGTRWAHELDEDAGLNEQAIFAPPGE